MRLALGIVIRDTADMGMAGALNLLIALGVSFMLVGCADDPVEVPAEPEQTGATQSTESSPLTVYPGDGEVGMGALFFGQLELRGNCLVLIERATKEEFVPVFPEAVVEWDEQTHSVRFLGRTLAVGADVTLGGGASGTADSSPKCPSLPTFIVVGTLPD